MDHRTRVAAAIKGLPVDRTPCAELVIGDELVQAMHGREVVTFDHRLDFVQTMGLDAICLHPCFALPAKQVPGTRDAVFNDLKKWVDTGLFTFAVLDGPVGWGCRLLGFEDLVVKLFRCHGDFQDIMAAVEHLNMATIERLAGNGINGILLADDIAYTRGPIVRPDVLSKTVFPSLIRQLEYAKRQGLTVFFHSDGNLTALLDDIVAAGFDGLQCIEALAGMDIGAVKAQYGHSLCLWGNLDPAQLLEDREPAELAYSVQQIIQAVGRGLIFGTSSGLFAGMRLDTIRTVYKTAQSTVPHPAGT